MSIIEIIVFNDFINDTSFIIFLCWFKYNEYYFNFTVFMEFVKQKITGSIFLNNRSKIIEKISKKTGVPLFLFNTDSDLTLACCFIDMSIEIYIFKG